MEKKSMKIKPWTRGNVAAVVATYVMNVVILTLIFVAIVAINGARGKDTLTEFFDKPEVFINFVLLLSLFVAVTS